MRALWTRYGPVALGAAALVLIVILWPAHPAPAPIPPDLRRTVDSLTVTHVRDSVVIDSLRGVVQLHDTAAARAARRAHVAEAGAVDLRSTADSLASVAVERDSDATAWRLAYSARTVEADSLRVAVALWKSAYQEQQRATMAARAALTIATDRLQALEQVNRELAQAVVDANRCTIVLGIPCPSRRTTFLAGALAGGAIGVAAMH